MSFNEDFPNESIGSADFVPSRFIYENNLLESFKDCVNSSSNFEGGLRFDFGSHREGMKMAIDTLGLTSQFEEKKLVIGRIKVASGGLESDLGDSIELLSKVPLLDLLEIAQVDHIDVMKDYGTSPRIQTSFRDGVINTSIVLREPLEESADGSSYTAFDDDEIVVMLGLECRYVPGFDNPRHELRYLLHDIQHDEANQRRGLPVVKLAEEIVRRSMRMLMPSSDYYIAIGRIASPKQMHEPGTLLGGVIAENRFIIGRDGVIKPQEPNREF